MKNFKTAFLSALALCLFLFLIIQCGLYAEQNKTFSTALADKEKALDASKQTIREKMLEIEDLQAQLTEAVSTDETKTESGFLKKGGLYLIDNENQLWTLRQLIAKDAEIEPGVPAAAASYRLRHSISFFSYGDTVSPFYLGTEESPFRGSFDGDGNRVTGYFPLINEKNIPEAMFYADSGAKIENLDIDNQTYALTNDGIHTKLTEQWEVTELERYLPVFPECSIYLNVSAWNLDIQKTAEALRNRWENISAKNGAYISMTFYPESEEEPADPDAYIQKLHTALYTLAGPEYTKMIEEALKQENGYLWFVRLENVNGLICCTFEIGKPDYYPLSEAYYVIVEQPQNREEPLTQCVRIPYTEMEHMAVGFASNYRLEQADVNFDGKQDLLIHEGYSGGSGGSWGNYRAMVWVEDSAEFAWFPSFPEQLVSLEFDQKRMISRGRMGAGEEYVIVYGIVNGEYKCTRKLVCQSNVDGSVIELFYYEMGELVKTHRLSDWNEKEDLYPDMDYWVKG